MIFDSWEEAEESFYKENDCLSDDSDKEDARLMNWMQENGHSVREDDPYFDNVVRHQQDSFKELIDNETD